jgi:2-aminoethylphosphonate transport system permease protein
MTVRTAQPAPAEAAPAARHPARLLPSLWLTAPLALVLVGIAWPLCAVLVESFATDGQGVGGQGVGRWVAVLGSSAFRVALGHTVWIALASTVGCVLLGTFLALVCAFVPFSGAHLVGRLIDSVLALPSFLITLAFTFLYGSAGVLGGLLGEGAPNLLTTQFGVIAAEITFFTPFVVRPVLAALSVLPREQLEVAASLGAGPVRVLRQVLLPEALPAIAAGGSLVLLLSLNEFGIVLFTGAKDVITVPVLIYTQGVVTLDLPDAAVAATAQLVASLALYLGYRAAFTRLDGTGGEDGAVVVPAH